jgi:hypothetical protein
MAVNLKTFDSVGGFSVDNTTLVNENKDIKNVNTLEVKNSFYQDSSVTHYILRGVNTAILATDDITSSIVLPSNTINFVEASIIAINDNGSATLNTKLESAIEVSLSGVVTDLGTMTTTIKDSIPTGQSWTIAPFTGGAVNRYSYTTTRSGTTRTVKWVAYVKVVSIAWT